MPRISNQCLPVGQSAAIVGSVQNIQATCNRWPSQNLWKQFYLGIDTSWVTSILLHSHFARSSAGPLPSCFGPPRALLSSWMRACQNFPQNGLSRGFLSSRRRRRAGAGGRSAGGKEGRREKRRIRLALFAFSRIKIIGDGRDADADDADEGALPSGGRDSRGSQRSGWSTTRRPCQ